LPETLLEAAEPRKGHPLSPSRNPDEYRQEQEDSRCPQGAARPAFEIAGRTQERSVGKFLCEVSKESTVTVVHLIYRSKNYESSSKDYDFSRVGMVEHWNAGARDVHLSMRHKDWLERPQSDETMVTYDLTGDGTETFDEQEKK